jgi:hypothetical protein
MCNHENKKKLIHTFTIIYLIVIIIIMRGENFVAHLDGLGGTPVAHHCVAGSSHLTVTGEEQSICISAVIILVGVDHRLELRMDCKSWSSSLRHRVILVTKT